MASVSSFGFETTAASLNDLGSVAQNTDDDQSFYVDSFNIKVRCTFYDV